VTPEVVTGGEAMALLLAGGGVPLAQATAFTRQVAGAESNVATGLARLGHRAGWFGRVGADGLGTAVLGELRRDGVDVSRAVVDPVAPTGLLIRDCAPGRPVEVGYHRSGSAGSRLAPGDVDPAYVAGARLLHLTGITPVLSDSAAGAARAALAAAVDAGVPVSFDPNLRRRLCPPERAVGLLRPYAAAAAVVLAGVEEAELLTGRTGRAAVAGWFLDRGARCVVLKDGPRGSWATDGSTAVEQPAVPVAVVDPVGAGDAYAAGFLSGWLRGLPLAEATREAAVVAALVLQVAGDTPGLPTAATRDAVLAGAADVAR
jgi:2-dehydro-3-deoxygluconokinase